MNCEDCHHPDLCGEQEGCGNSELGMQPFQGGRGD